MGLQLDQLNSIQDAFFKTALEYPDRVVYRQAVIAEDDNLDKPRAWRAATYRTAQERVCKLAQYLRSLGFQSGTKAAIISNSRPEWMEADIAILSAGGVSVSVYPSLTSSDIGYILYDSESEFVFAENQEQVDKLLHLMEHPCSIPATEEREATESIIRLKKIITFEHTDAHELLVHVDKAAEGFSCDPSFMYHQSTRNELACLVYTSGTTGPPKGVMQSHGNHLANVRQAMDCGLCSYDDSIMLFLPVAHSFAKLMGYLGFLTPTYVYFPGIADKRSSKPNPDSVTKDIRESEATLLPLVPRVLEKMQAGIFQKANSPGPLGALVRMTLWSSRLVYEAEQRGERAPLLATVAYRLTAGLRRKIGVKLFGTQFKYAISGGAKLNPENAVFFDSLGLEVLEGYGLTETCVATNVNRTGMKRIGTVGPVLAPDIEVRIAEDGEILFRGPNVTSGYYKRQFATKLAWDREGWFHTGDLGSLDHDGFLKIEGRKKEILVTSYGKNIAPEEVEQEMKSCPLVSQAVLVGDGRPFCTALLTLDADAVQAWSAKEGKNVQEPYEASETIRQEVERFLEQMNERFASYQTVKRFRILPGEFTIDNGFLTPTFKVKRQAVLNAFAEEVEELYREH